MNCFYVVDEAAKERLEHAGCRVLQEKQDIHGRRCWLMSRGDSRVDICAEEYSNVCFGADKALMTF